MTIPRLSGKSNPNWRGGKIKCVCRQCGFEFFRWPSQIGTGKRGKYCSTKCKAEAQRELRGDKNHQWKGGRVEVVCCICGKKSLAWPYQLECGERQYCSMKCRGLAQAGSWTGEKNPRWKGGITPNVQRARNSEEYKIWRNSVFTRDNFTCQECGDARGGNLHAHHLFTFADFEEHRFEIWNGITLCAECHAKRHTTKEAVS
jgi:5-methylcytosine-specific restriction endonuclease McrA